jgi:opine dehydrogenase
VTASVGTSTAASTAAITVVGAGPGGLALAGAAAAAGADVRLYDIAPAALARLHPAGRLRLTGVVSAEVAITLATTDPASAVDGADLAILAVPPAQIGSAVRAIAPHLPAGGVILLAQSYFGGALVAAAALPDAGATERIAVAEAGAFPFACSLAQDGSVHIAAKKRRVPVASLPSGRTAAVVKLISSFVPGATASPSVLGTSLSDVSASIHVPVMVANAGRIEAGSSFDLFAEGFTASAAAMAEGLDAERLDVARAVGVKAPSVREWITDTYGVEVPDMRAAGKALAQVFGPVPAPVTMRHRYLTDDVPCLAVPASELAGLLGVRAPVHHALIEIASVICGEDFRANGRNAELLGLGGLRGQTVDQICARLTGGST